MEIAIMSDIHGNHIALETCVQYALSRGITRFLFLGDYVGELAYPERTMEIIHRLSAEYECCFIRGNKENYWIDYQDHGKKGWRDNDSTTGALLYTYRRLTEKDLSFFRALPISREIAVKGLPALTVCHGSPYKANQKLLPDDEKTFAVMEKTDTFFILCGHTHIQNKIEYGGKKVLNPGSVGVPLHSGGKSQFMILRGNGGLWEEEFVSLEYDAARAIGEIHTSGLGRSAPYWCAVTENLLKSGEVSHQTALNKAMELCREETGSCTWPDIPEQYWEKAVSEMTGIPNKEGIK